MKILLIEDEKITRIALSDTLTENGYTVSAFATGIDGLATFESHKFDVVLTDLRLPKMSGIDILQKVKEKDPACQVIVMTAYATVDTAVQALKLGAYDYLTKPFSPDELLALLDKLKQLNDILNENKKLKKRIRSFENRTLVGESPKIRQLISTLEVVSQNDFTVLIQGESGTGKEVVSRFLHYHSPRNTHPFIAINCAAIPETLLESELFGYEKGAFTGANKQHKGYFERAHLGTLFIDDIGDFPITLQVKLLRFLQEREIYRVGGDTSIPLDTRIIAATKMDLQELIRQNKFREDLYYRLNIIPLNIPPLRDRKEDIPLLIEHFLEKHSKESVKPVFSKEQLQALEIYQWPGNIRELENIVGRIIAMPDTEYILEQLNAESVQKSSYQIVEKDISEDGSFPGLQSHIRNQEKIIIYRALKKAGQNISDAARLLKIPRSTLRSKIEKLNIIDPATRRSN